MTAYRFFVNSLYYKAVLWIIHTSLLDRSYVFLGSLRICFGKEDILSSFLRRVNALEWPNSDIQLWFAIHSSLYSLGKFHVPIVLLFCRKQTLVIKPDKEHMQPHFLLLDIILSLKEREGILKVSFVIYFWKAWGK